MVGQGFVEVEAEIPPHTEAVGDQTHQEPLRAHIVKEHHDLELEKDHWVNAWPPTGGIAVLDQVADKAEIEHPLQVAVEVVGGHQLLKGYGRDWREAPTFCAHQRRPPLRRRHFRARSPSPPALNRTAVTMA
jgi:hypothetical protein